MVHQGTRCLLSCHPLADALVALGGQLLLVYSIQLEVTVDFLFVNVAMLDLEDCAYFISLFTIFHTS